MKSDSTVAPGGRARILVVDDEEDSRRLLRRTLEALGHEVEPACDGIEALAKVRLDVDLVLLDVTMPKLDGYAVARSIREQPEHLDLPIVMVTGLEGRDSRLRALELGVNDFLTKPFDIAELKARCTWLLRLKAAHDTIRRHRSELEATVERRTAALRLALEDTAAAERRTYEAHLDTIRRLVLAAEHKDRDTAAHIERIGRYCAVIAEELGLLPQQVELLRHASQMHDVGKLGVPDHILLKRGKLDAAEWEIMRQHPAMGARILGGSPSPLLQLGEVIALTHHEKWNGTGYPRGLSAEAIPLPGRICAVADVFDALTSARPYRARLANDQVYTLMREEEGEHFDPDVLAAFMVRREDIEAAQRTAPAQEEHTSPHHEPTAEPDDELVARWKSPPRKRQAHTGFEPQVGGQASTTTDL